MIRSRLRAVPLALAAAVLGCVSVYDPLHAQSATPSDAQLVIIRQNCLSAQSAMQLVQDSDLVSRTIRGRSYERTINLMSSLNSRVASNRLNQPRLIEIVSDMQRNLSDFTASYSTYENAMKATLTTKCQSQPAEFYQRLTTARVERDKVATSVETMRQLIDEYRTIVDDIRNDATKQGGGQS